MPTILSKLSIRWSDDGSDIERSIDIDCSINEGYEIAAEVTEHAVETGANISDHVRAKNETVTLEAFISNTPIETPQFGMDGATGAVAAASIVVGGRTINPSTFQFSQPFNRAVACDTQLRGLVKAGKRVTVFTGVRIIADCVITRYRWDRNAENGNDLALTLELTRIRTATTRTVAAPAQRRARVEQNRGSQPAVEDNRTAAARGVDALGLRIQ